MSTLRITAALTATAALGLGLAVAPAGAVHESHHGPFAGTTTQDTRIVLRVRSHTRLGIRFRWRAACESGAVARVARLRDVPVTRDGRFAARGPHGVRVRGRIGFDPQGNPAFPEPFSFAANEARGRLRATFEDPVQGRCATGEVRWEARR